MAEPPPWEKGKAKPAAPSVPAAKRPGDAPSGPRRPFSKDVNTAEGPQSTVFIGGPARPKNDDSSVLLVETQIPYIAVTAGPGKGKQWQLRAARMLIGREQPADIVVEDAAASRRHAQIYKKGERWYLKDLDSTNGTYLDGPLRGTERILWDGDVFRIGDWEMTFSDPNSAR